jgi:hypothetical protein
MWYSILCVFVLQYVCACHSMCYVCDTVQYSAVLGTRDERKLPCSFNLMPIGVIIPISPRSALPCTTLAPTICYYFGIYSCSFSLLYCFTSLVCVLCIEIQFAVICIAFLQLSPEALFLLTVSSFSILPYSFIPLGLSRRQLQDSAYHRPVAVQVIFVAICLLLRSIFMHLLTHISMCIRLLIDL